MITELAIGLRLLLATLLGGVIGLQRESINRPAGFRTHTLVATGSALIMLVSIYGFGQASQLADPARLAAQVVSGIGFLGAGTILKEGNTIRGLTTAASLWVVSGIGLAVGAGFFTGAVVATALVYVSLSSLGRLDEYIFHRRQYQSLTLLVCDLPGQLGRIASVMGQYNVSIQNVRLKREAEDEAQVRVNLQVKLPADCTVDQLSAALVGLDGVTSVQFGRL